jgi:hypothetical protein
MPNRLCSTGGHATWAMVSSQPPLARSTAAQRSAAFAAAMPRASSGIIARAVRIQLAIRTSRRPTPHPGGAPGLQPPRNASIRARRASGWLAGTFDDLVPAQRNMFRTAAAVVVAPLRPARLAGIVGKTSACLTPPPPLRDDVIVDCAWQRASPRSPEPPPRSGVAKMSYAPTSASAACGHSSRPSAAPPRRSPRRSPSCRRPR